MSRGKFTHKSKAGSFIYYTLVTLLLAVMAVSGWHVLRYYSDSQQQEARYDELAALVEAARENAATPTWPLTPGETFSPEDLPQEDGSQQPSEEVSVLPEYAPLLAINPDIVGWIQIEGTKINYPVMQSPDEPDFYINHNFDRKSNARGCIYAEEACDIFKPSDNITLYGHHMTDGSMFTSLINYLNASYWEDHRYIHFDTLYEHHTYEVFAVFKTTAAVTKGFPYHNFVDADNEKEFSDFITGCTSRAFYDTGIVPEYGDKVICLSTCEYSQHNGRLVVCAVRID